MAEYSNRLSYVILSLLEGVCGPQASDQVRKSVCSQKPKGLGLLNLNTL